MENRNAENPFSPAARRTKESIRQFTLNRANRFAENSAIKKKFKARRLILTGAKTTQKLTSTSARYQIQSGNCFSKVAFPLPLKTLPFTTNKGRKEDAFSPKTCKEALDMVNIFMHRPGELHFKTFEKEGEGAEYMVALKSDHLRNYLTSNKVVEFNKLKFSKFVDEILASGEWERLVQSKAGDGFRITRPYHTA